MKRNRQFLRPAAESSHEPEVTHKENPKVPKSLSKPGSPKQGSVEGTVAMETQVPLFASQKTRTRCIRLPSRFKDFDMKR